MPKDTDNKRRRMIFMRELNPETFLFFFERGNTGRSWSVRNYAVAGTCALRYAREFPYTADQIHAGAQFSFDAPTVDTGDLDFWHALTIQYNSKYLGGDGQPAVRTEARTAPIPAPAPNAFPILFRDRFQRIAKAGKREDLQRMLCSPQSEDWVTWNLFQLLLAQRPDQWWEEMLAAARRDNPDLLVPEVNRASLALELWRVVPPPPGYEAASRERMRRCGNPDWVGRSMNPKPVEGPSEIDIAIENAQVLLYAEAKLGSDISLRTTYDPQRNQILRNIDCVLEDSGGERVPLFWMVAKDDGPTRLYTQLMHQYRERPETLASQLPHRDPARVGLVARNLAIVLWRDITPAVTEAVEGDTPEILSVKAELRRRIGL